MEDLICVSRDRVQASLFSPQSLLHVKKKGVDQGWDNLRDGLRYPEIPSLLATNINFLTSSLKACLIASQNHILFTSNCSGRSGVEECKKKITNVSCNPPESRFFESGPCCKDARTPCTLCRSLSRNNPCGYSHSSAELLCIQQAWTVKT